MVELYMINLKKQIKINLKYLPETITSKRTDLAFLAVWSRKEENMVYDYDINRHLLLIFWRWWYWTISRHICDSWFEECHRILDRFYSTSFIFSDTGRDFVSLDSIELREIIQPTDDVLFNSDFTCEWT